MRDLRGAYLKLRPGEKVSEYIHRHIKGRRIFVGCEGESRSLPRPCR
jgi:hypothetical protein